MAQGEPRNLHEGLEIRRDFSHNCKKKNPENKKDRKEKVRLDQIQKYFGF